MLYQVNIIAQTKNEKRILLEMAEIYKKEGKGFPYKIAGVLPADKIDDLIQNLKSAIVSGVIPYATTFENDETNTELL